jgi:hypothetical protein
VDFDSCVNCNAGLIAASTICPQCGWPKDKPIESVEEPEIEVSTEPIVSETKRIYRPLGIRLLGIFHVVFGIFLVISAIVLGSVTLMSVMMIGGMDSSDGISGIVIGLHETVGWFSADEINELAFSPGSNFEGKMQTMNQAVGIAIVELLLGMVAFVIGRGLFRGKRWAWIVTIVASVISIPVFASFIGELNNLFIAGSIVFEGLVLYYMWRPKVRKYFNQDVIKKSKNKKIKD